MKAALLVGLVVAVVWFFEKMFGTPMVNRPIIISPLVGWVLGDLKAGLIMGASLELVFMGAIQVGAAVPPELLIGSALGTAFAILSNAGPEVAVTLGLPIALLAQSLKVIVFIIRSSMMEPAVRMAEKANIKGLFAWNIFGLLIQCAMYFGVAFTAVLFGSAAVEAFVGNIPATLMHGLEVAGKLLPAVGFALLLQPMMNGKNILYFILGFILIGYLQLPILAITIFGAILAFIIVFEVGQGPAVSTGNDDLEGLFDE